MTSLINQVEGVVTSFSVDINGKMVNYKELLRDHGNTCSSSSTHHGHRSKYFNDNKTNLSNIVDALERKYSKGPYTIGQDEEDDEEQKSDDNGMIGSGDDDDDDDEDEGDVNGDVDLEQAPNDKDNTNGNTNGNNPNNPSGTSTKKKKTSTRGDYYDMEDDFIDDSEIAEDIDNQLLSKAISTKYDAVGFYSHAGEIETFGGPTTSTHAGGGKANRKSSTKSTASSSSGRATNVSVDVTITPGIKPTNIANITVPITTTNSSSGSVSGSVTPKSNRKPKVKTAWEPNDAVLSAIQTFRGVFNQMIQDGYKMKKANFPRELDSALNTFDQVVMAHIPHADTHYIGYVEVIADTLGGDGSDTYGITPGVVTNSLKRVRLRRSAILMKKIKDSTIEALTTAIPTKISAYQPDTHIDANATTMSVQDDTTTTTSTPVENFELTCNWDKDLKALLYAADDAHIQWLQAENKYRNCLTNVDKKDLSSSDKALYNEKEEITKFHYAIKDLFPASCALTSVQHIRKKLSAERSRIKKAKEKTEYIKVAEAIKRSSVGSGGDEINSRNLPVAKQARLEDGVGVGDHGDSATNTSSTTKKNTTTSNSNSSSNSSHGGETSSDLPLKSSHFVTVPKFNKADFIP